MTTTPGEPAPDPEVRPSVDRHHPIDLEGVPAEEDMETADVSERVDLDPEEQVNRPDRENETIADSGSPEDL